MGLEDILQAQGRLQSVGSIAEAYKKKEPRDLIADYANYLNSYGRINDQGQIEGLTDNEKNALYNLNQFQFLRELTGSIKSEKKALVEATSKNLDEAINAIPEEALLQIMYQLPPNEKEAEKDGSFAQLHAQYMKIKSGADRGDPRAYLEDLKGRNKKAHDIFRKNFKNEDLASLAKSHASLMRGALESRFVDQEGENKGKLKSGELKNYIMGNINSYDDKLKTVAYELIGSNVSNE